MKGLDYPKGFRVGVASAGIKKPGRNDVAVIVSETLSDVAGVFTTNLFAAAPVKYCREILQKNMQVRAIAVNSGNANAGTGEAGYKDTVEMAEITAHELNCRSGEVLVASTGVIGRRLPMDKIRAGIKSAIESCRDISHGDSAASAIMTTDTVEKIAEREIDGIRIGGIAKGAGMIHPNMATMLCFLTTDADLPRNLIQPMLKRVADRTFNCISVDNDTSTNDSLILMANGTAGKVDEKRFESTLEDICDELAKKIVADGEGATKFVTIEVKDAKNEIEAYKAADAVATSMLVKTALFGNDPNWGRILAAVGRSGAEIDVEKVKISVCGFTIFEKGGPLELDLAKVSERMKTGKIDIEIKFGLGAAQKRVFTTDLSREYVSINADYTT